MRFSQRLALGLGMLAAAGMLLAGGRATAQPPVAATAKAQPFVSPLFGDNMVLQRGKANRLWGWAEPGEKVTVEVAGKTATGVAGADRRWEVKLDPPAVGGPYVVKISGHATVELKNVLVGDVWLCGGQSNMGLPLKFTRDAEAVVKAANEPEIRYFTVAGRSAYKATSEVDGKWQVVTPETADWVSAVGYYFARKLHEETHIPIGLVVDAVGGTPAEAWTSAESLAPLHDFDVPLAELKRLTAAGAPEYGNFVMHWYDEFDAGLKGNWAAPELDDAGWKTVPVPGGFAELGVPEQPALVWFRKEIVLPDPLPKGKAMLFLGSIERMDTAYVNGKEVGGSAWVENPRVYFVPEGVLKAGRNVIAVRVLKTKPDGGWLSKPDVLKLTVGETTVALAGEWKAQLSVDARAPHALPLTYENWPVMPTVLYEGMLRPVAPLAITGAIWYQGEQNSERGYQYRKILPVMIGDWRKVFGQGDFPFYIVSLPAFKARSAVPVDDEWAETRESQALTAAAVKNSCLAVTIDTGEADNIHPKEKEPVGDRLAACALAGVYGKKVVTSGPTVERVETRKDAIRLRFAHTDGGLVAKGGTLKEFAVAGEDRVWHWAEARIEGKTVVVTAKDVAHPVAVRYAWQSNPEATLFNGAGLPAGPFRTDTWPGKTESHRPY